MARSDLERCMHLSLKDKTVVSIQVLRITLLSIMVWTKRGLLLTDPIERGLRVIEISILTEPAEVPETPAEPAPVRVNPITGQAQPVKSWK